MTDLTIIQAGLEKTILDDSDAFLLQESGLVTRHALLTAIAAYVNKGSGWSISHDAAYTQAIPMPVTTVPSLLTSDGLGALTDFSQMPLGAAGGFFNETTNLIEPLKLGDALSYRITFQATPSNANVVGTTRLTIDEGGVPVTIASKVLTFPSTATRLVSLQTSSFVLANYLASGAGIYISTDSGSLEIYDFKVFIVRTHVGR